MLFVIIYIYKYDLFIHWLYSRFRNKKANDKEETEATSPESEYDNINDGRFECTSHRAEELKSEQDQIQMYETVSHDTK